MADDSYLFNHEETKVTFTEIKKNIEIDRKEKTFKNSDPPFSEVVRHLIDISFCSVEERCTYFLKTASPK